MPSKEKTPKEKFLEALLPDDEEERKRKEKKKGKLE